VPASQARNEACSFLKKRTKKPLTLWLGVPGRAEAKTTKRFLLLFFKKAGLAAACLCFPPGSAQGGKTLP
jgi:hypothetical protein